jgi:hypothetical protein
VAWFVFLATRLLRVEIDDCALYVSDYLTEIRIPFSGIAAVREIPSCSGFKLGIELRHPSPFGTRIVFRPRGSTLRAGIHPTARKLQALSEQAQNGPEVDQIASVTEDLATRPLGPVWTFIAGILVLGVACGVMYVVVVGVQTGEIGMVGKRSHGSVSRQSSPGDFWIVVGFITLCSLFIAWLGVYILRDVFRKDGDDV